MKWLRRAALGLIVLGLGASRARAVDALCVELSAVTLSAPLDDALKLTLARQVVQCKSKAFSAAMNYSSPQGYLQQIFERWTLTPAANPPEKGNAMLNARNEAEYYLLRALHESGGLQATASERAAVQAMRRQKTARERTLTISSGLTTNKVYVLEAYVGAVRAADRTPNALPGRREKKRRYADTIQYRNASTTDLSYAYGRRPGALSTGKPVPPPARPATTVSVSRPASGPASPPPAPPRLESEKPDARQPRVAPELLKRLADSKYPGLGEEKFIRDCLAQALELLAHPTGPDYKPAEDKQKAALEAMRTILTSEKLTIDYSDEKGIGAQIVPGPGGAIKLSLAVYGVQAIQRLAENRDKAVDKGAAYLLDCAVSLYAHQAQVDNTRDWIENFKRNVLGVRL